jgi:outer membrane protein assembly factor BamB
MFLFLAGYLLLLNFSSVNEDYLTIHLMSKEVNYSNKKHVYSYDGKLFDLDQLKFLPKEYSGEISEVKRDNHHAAFFGSGNTDMFAVFDGITFELKEDRSITISDSKGKIIRTIPDPDLSIKLDNTSGNSVFFSTSTGVISIMRMNGEEGYRVLKYNSKGELIQRWRLEHTRYIREGNTIYSKPYLYYRACTDKEIVFSSIHYSGVSDVGIVLNHVTGEEKKTDGIVGGIIMNTKDTSLAGLIRFKEKKIEVEISANKWFIENANGDNTVKTILKDNVLYVASYHWISTGSALHAYDATTGKPLWTGDVRQMNTSHSEYYNTVYLTMFEDKLILEGNEAHGNYLQILDAKTGKSLFSTIEW